MTNLIVLIRSEWMSATARWTTGAFLMLCFTTVGNASAANFNARGNEPGWHIEVTDLGISFRAMDGETFKITPAPEAVIANDVETYLAVVDGRSFSLTIADGPCVDTMSGMPYPRTVTITLGDRNLSGCGGDPGSLFRGEWMVEEIGGKAIVAGSKPTIFFGPDGRVNGNGSCNRFFGEYALNGEGLTISDLGSSRMACEQPLMNQENIFMETLGAVSGFAIDPENRLVLRVGDGRMLVARRV